MKKIIIVDGGPRRNMNTAAMLDAFARACMLAVCLAMYSVSCRNQQESDVVQETAVFAEETLPETENELDMDFVLIPANPDFAFARDLNGQPGEKSPITREYRIAKYPVTNAEYAVFCKETEHRFPRYWKNGIYPAGKDNHPVLEISVDDVIDYCRFLEQKHPGWKFRLPTEAEWENAAAGPQHFAFPWGNSDQVRLENGAIVSPFNFNAVVASHYLTKSPNMTVTFYHNRSPYRGESGVLRELISVGANGQVRGWINHSDYTGFVYTDLFQSLSEEGGFTSAVDQYPDGKSPYGCFDMAGNSWDWTSSEIIAANGAERGRTVNAIRGGSWYANKNSCRTDFRGEGRLPHGVYNTVGFRLVAKRQKTKD